jgi:hypothetical protein
MGGPRSQAGDEEELYGLSRGDPLTVVVLLPIITMNATRGDRKGKEEKRVIDSESGRTSYLYSPLLPC